MSTADIVPITIAMPGVTLAAAVHRAEGTVGAIIVSGAPQGRFGAHRGLFALARALAEAKTPSMRFDRRGLGDSDGEDPGFTGLAPDIAAARAAFVATLPHVRRTIGIGLCDGAAALALDPQGFDALVLLNPWTLDTDRAADLPPRAAVAVRYRDRLTSPAAWGRLLSGGVDLAKLARGLGSLVTREKPGLVAGRIAARLAAYPGPVLILLAERDNTAQAFAALWRTPLFAPVRAHGRAEIAWLPGATHTFAGDEAVVAAHCVAFAARLAGG